MNIPRLEPAQRFVTRAVLLNRFHAPDEEEYRDARHVLGAIHNGFPDAPVHEQAAYVVARIVRDRPFREANFRTAWDYMADLLDHRGFDLEASLAEAQELGNRVWDMAEEAPEEMEAQLAAWFKPRIHKGMGRHS